MSTHHELRYCYRNFWYDEPSGIWTREFWTGEFYEYGYYDLSEWLIDQATMATVGYTGWYHNITWPYLEGAEYFARVDGPPATFTHSSLGYNPAFPPSAGPPP